MAVIGSCYLVLSFCVEHEEKRLGYILLVFLQVLVATANLYFEKGSRQDFLKTKALQKSCRENVDLQKTLNFLPDGVIILDASTKKVKFINSFADQLFEQNSPSKDKPLDDFQGQQEQGHASAQVEEDAELHKLCLFEPFEDSLNTVDPLQVIDGIRPEDEGRYSLDGLL